MQGNEIYFQRKIPKVFLKKILYSEFLSFCWLAV